MSETVEKAPEIITKTDQFVLKLFKEKLPNSFLYHNYNHTVRVVKSTKEIIENSQINVKQEEALLLAAWLHDIGYTEQREGHEKAGAEIAKAFLKEQGEDPETIDLVVDLILSTIMKTEPKSDLERILTTPLQSGVKKILRCLQRSINSIQIMLPETGNHRKIKT